MRARDRRTTIETSLHLHTYARRFLHSGGGGRSSGGTRALRAIESRRRCPRVLLYI